MRRALGYPPAQPPPFPVAVAPLPPLDAAAEIAASRAKTNTYPPPAQTHSPAFPLGSLDDDRDGDATEPAALERGDTKRPSRSICRSTMIRAGIVRRTRSRAWSAVDGIGKGTGVVASRRIRRDAHPKRRVVASVGFRSSPRVVARGEAARALSAAPRRATRAKEREPSSTDATIRILHRRGLRRGERRGSKRGSRPRGSRPRGSRGAACNASRRISSTNPGSNPAFTSARPRVVFRASPVSIARVCIKEGNTSCRLAPPIIRAGRMHLASLRSCCLRCLVWWYSMMLFCCRVTDDPPARCMWRCFCFCFVPRRRARRRGENGLSPLRRPVPSANRIPPEKIPASHLARRPRAGPVQRRRGD